MQLQIYQWLVPLIAIFFIIRVVRRYRNHGYNKVTALVWAGFWVFIAVLAIVPDFVSNKLASALGFKSNVTAVIFVALGLLFVLNFYLSTQLNRTERQVTNLVRLMAKQGFKEKAEVKLPSPNRRAKRASKKRKSKKVKP